MTNETIVLIKHLGIQDYTTCWKAMQAFTDQRTSDTIDEIWVVQHPPVYTQGQNGKPEHILNPGTIPVIKVDRGGQVTYHGPGQLVLYPLINLKRKHLNVRDIVTILEQSVIALLNNYKLPAEAKREAPGVYLQNKKICSIGLRIRKGCSFHGLALNISMDLSPFSQINPCGYAELQMTQLIDFIPSVTVEQAATQLIDHLIKKLGYTTQQVKIDTR